MVDRLFSFFLSSEFAKERERVDTRRKFFKVRRQQQLDRQVHAYQSWIDKAGKLTRSSDNTLMIDNRKATKHTHLVWQPLTAV